MQPRHRWLRGDDRKKYEQKQMGFLLSDQQVPVQNEAFQDLLNRQSSRFFGKLVLAQVQANL